MTKKKSGFVAIIGRPNVGKSTLMNTILGKKIAIVSHVPQTTRNTIRGIYTKEDAQIVFLDTPGIHESAKMFNKILSSQALTSIGEADMILYMVDVTRPFGQEEEIIVDMLLKAKKPVILAYNKVDVKGSKVAENSIFLREKFKDFPAVTEHFISALKNSYVDELLETILDKLTEGEFYYPEGMYTDMAIDFQVSELIRESILHLSYEEVPHATKVEVKHIDDDSLKLISIYADILVEREGQKGIMVGKGASKLKEIGIQSRQKLEDLFNKKVFLKLQVKVDENWRAKMY